MKTIYFLSGLPRTGTTVLSSIINQNKNIHCTSTSGLLDFLSGVNYAYNKVSERSFDFNKDQLKNIFKGIVGSYYDHIDQEIIIDKWRGWIDNIPQIKEIITKTPKIVCTYRPIEEIVTSFLYLLKRDPNNFVDKELYKNNIVIDNNNRAKFLWNNGVVGETYDMFVRSLDNKHDICYVSYHDIVNSPDKVMKKIYQYCNLNGYDHQYSNLNTNITDNDSFWNIKNLHAIRKTLKQDYKNPYDYMDVDLVEDFKTYNKIFEEIK